MYDTNIVEETSFVFTYNFDIIRFLIYLLIDVLNWWQNLGV